MNKTKLDIFGDGRKTPKISINVKVKVKTNSFAETNSWNRVFGYIMKKQRTKLEFLAVDALRNLSLNNIYLKDIEKYITSEDYKALSQVEDIFNNRLTADVKAFILAILRVPLVYVIELSKARTQA